MYWISILTKEQHHGGRVVVASTSGDFRRCQLPVDQAPWFDWRVCIVYLSLEWFHSMNQVQSAVREWRYRAARTVMYTCWTIRQKWKWLVVSTARFSSGQWMDRRFLKIAPTVRWLWHHSNSKQRAVMIALLECIVLQGQHCHSAKGFVSHPGVDRIVTWMPIFKVRIWIQRRINFQMYMMRVRTTVLCPISRYSWKLVRHGLSQTRVNIPPRAAVCIRWKDMILMMTRVPRKGGSKLWNPPRNVFPEKNQSGKRPWIWSIWKRIPTCPDLNLCFFRFATMKTNFIAWWFCFL